MGGGGGEGEEGGGKEGGGRGREVKQSCDRREELGNSSFS